MIRRAWMAVSNQTPPGWTLQCRLTPAGRQMPAWPREGPQTPGGWGLRYATELHITNDAQRCAPRAKAEEAGYKADEYGRWSGQDGEVLLPLYAGRMIGQFDFSKKGWVSGTGRAAVWRDIPMERKFIEPQFLMRASDHRAACSARPFKLVMMNISAATNSRSMLTAIFPD